MSVVELAAELSRSFISETVGLIMYRLYHEVEVAALGSVNPVETDTE
jgi:hypothetical protein